MKLLETYIKNKDISKIKSIYHNLKQPENKLSYDNLITYSEILIKMEELVGIKDDKGFWEYSFFQKIIIPNEEQNIKAGLRLENGLNIKKIQHYINPVPNKEEIIVENYNNGIILSKIDKIIYDSYIEKKNRELKKDLNDIQKLGAKAIPTTNDGKIHYMMYLLSNFIKNKQYESVCNIYLKLQEPKYILTSELKTQYNELLEKLNVIVNDLDLIKLQFTKFYNQMPPLNEKGFNKFDEWQIKTIQNIDNNISTIISAPTSAGKSVISGYVSTKGRSLFIVPTDALAWQVASYIGSITDTDVPIITLTFNSIPKRDLFIKQLNEATTIVGTSECILDFLPFINNNFAWVIFDEIHMMGKHEGSGMEIIAKILNNVPFLGLSATIGNIEELQSWFETIRNQKPEIIICDKRFFNLQKYFYNNNEIIMINPLGLVNKDDFIDKSVLNKTFTPTPLDSWSLVTKLLENNIELGELNPYKYFSKLEVIELTKTNIYFNELINFMVQNYELYNDQINKILSEYNSYDFEDYDANLIDVFDKLYKENKLPAIIFQQNTISCLEIIRKLAEDLDNIENIKYPDLRKERVNNDKKNKSVNKKIEKDLIKLTDKQLDKKLKDNKDFIFDFIIDDDICAPHNDFIYNKDTKFTDIEIKEWAEKFKMYFPCINGDYHYLIRLLWRGIGIYVNGLPDTYLRLIQKLASMKKLAFVISDISLVFGISMPFRTSVIYKNNNCDDNLNSMIYHQMAGRAGRRGLDKEGNVIFVGYSWTRIKELSISSIPNIEGNNKLIWTKELAFLHNNNNNYMKINQNMFNTTNTTNFDQILENNYNTIWSFCIKQDINVTQLLWMYRYTNEGIIIYYLIPHLRRYFEICNPNDENTQIDLAYVLSNFIHTFEPNTIDNKLQNNIKFDFTHIIEKLNEIGIEILPFIDDRIWISIRNNKLFNNKDEILRQRLFDFSVKIKSLQHYCYHNKYINLTKLLGKLLTRIWWIYHSSSPLLQ